MSSQLKVDSVGTKRYYLNGQLHREDGPAVEYASGEKHWYFYGKKLTEEEFLKQTKKMPECKVDSSGTKRYYLNGKLHRVDGPAIERANGDKRWYLNGELHRVDGPAIEYASGNKRYYLNGQPHREDGPAIEFANGNKYWYLHGKHHREDGPATEFADGSKYWYLHDKELTETEFLKQTKKMPECKIDSDGTKRYYLNGKLHREDGPAVEYASGEKYWYLNDNLHREDGPAIEYANGTKEWYLNGNPHREDGPAIECANGDKIWYLNGQLHREDGPAVEYADGNKYWYLYGKELTEQEFLEQIKKNTNNKKEENNTMSNQIVAAFKKSAKKAPYRVARMQALTVGKKKILELAQSKMSSEGFAMASAFLNSDVGEGTLLSFIGVLGPHVPKVGQDPRVQQLCEEFLDEGVAKGANEVFTLLTSLLTPALTSMLQALPSAEEVGEQVKEKVIKKKRTRVGTKSRISAKNENHLEEDPDNDNTMRASASAAE